VNTVLRRRRSARLRPRGRLQFAAVLGISDGILNALILASATVLHGAGLHLELAVRVGVVAAVSAAFTVFVAEYAQYRAELAQAERQLMYTSSGRLAATSLGRAIRREAFAAATVAALSSFIGASAPLVVGALLPRATWMALVISVAALGALGATLSVNVGGRRLVWVLALILAGIVVTAVGVRVDLV
jgi:predicted membrane protein (TIGR00267 family)